VESSVGTAARWADLEFSGAQLGDSRRVGRLVSVAAALVEKPRGALTRSFLSYAELKAAYRLFACEDVTFERIASPHWSRTREACSAPGEYLMIEDTTLLDFTSHRAVEGLGHVGDHRGRGLMLHTTLALRIERWNEAHEPQVIVEGLLGQKCWTRKGPPKGAHEPRAERASRERESQRWAHVFSGGGPPPETRWTYVADRESDIHEVFATCRDNRVDLIIRAYQKRKVADDHSTVFQAVAKAPLQGRYEMDIRTRAGRPARRAQIEVRATAVTLYGTWRPGGKSPSANVNVVEAREVNPLAGVEPIHWVLLTNWPVDSFEKSSRVIKAYTRRWLIEEYHKALKTGAQIEQTQLSTADRIQALLGVLSIVAVRLLTAKLLAETEPDVKLIPSDVGPEILAILEVKLGKPKEGWTYLNVFKSIARFGGFLARKSDGNPGWLTIWRGWHDLNLMAQGFSFAEERP
jgi:hypothetical protein